MMAIARVDRTLIIIPTRDAYKPSGSNDKQGERSGGGGYFSLSFYFYSPFPLPLPLLLRTGLTCVLGRSWYQLNYIYMFIISRNSMKSLQCSSYHAGSKVLIMGDADHAMIPFLAQGVNSVCERILSRWRYKALWRFNFSYTVNAQQVYQH